MFLEPAQHPELAVTLRLRTRGTRTARRGVNDRRAVARIAADGITLEVELTEADLADLGGFVAPIPTIFA